MILGYSNEKSLISPLVGADLVPYFKVELKNHGLSAFADADLSSSITSFSVSEKMGEATTITLSIIDQLGLTQLYFNQRNKEILVEWGIKTINPRFTLKETDEITGAYTRGKMNCIIADLGDIELRDGISTFTTTLRIGTKNSTQGKFRVFNFGTIGDMFKKLCSEIGAKSYIKFKAESKPLNDDYYFIQNNSTNLAFLREMCIAHNLKLVTTDGGTVSVVITTITITDMAYVNDSETFAGRVKTSGKYHYLDYGNANSNIISGKLSTNNNGGTGSTASIVDGKLQLTASRGETVSVYELDTAKVRVVLRDRKNKSVKDAYELVAKINSMSQEELYGTGGLYETYFKQSQVNTYPEGQGYTASFEVVANPLFNINDPVWLGMNTIKDESGIPKFLRNPEMASGIPEKFRTNGSSAELIKKTLWHFTSIEQSISTDGYKMNVEIGR